MGRRRVVELHPGLDHVHRERDRPQEHAGRSSGRDRGHRAAVGTRPADRRQRVADRLVRAEEAEVTGHLPHYGHGQPAEQAADPVVAHDVLRCIKKGFLNPFSSFILCVCVCTRGDFNV